MTSSAHTAPGQDNLEAFEALERRIRTLLPDQYQETYEELLLQPMRSAGLKYAPDGKVAWDEIWGSFCDLAMAGGPPHKGALLEPASRAEIEAQPDRYREAVDEICRGVHLVTGLNARAGDYPGWIRVACTTEAMASWLVRAIVVENVATRCERIALFLPAGPHYRLEKEIKNVVTVIAKTCHYWNGHIDLAQQWEIRSLLTKMDAQCPLIQPALDVAPGDRDAPDTNQQLRAMLAASIRQLTGLATSNHQYRGWLGLDFPSISSAIWVMRALVASNILARRENTALFVPLNPASDRTGSTVAQTLASVHRFAQSKNIL
jgi:sirohydrochlorin cobaltochelatase